MTTIPLARPQGGTHALREEDEPRAINRREFLSYAWGVATTVLLLEAGVTTFNYAYPRFLAGEFGGKFTLGTATALPSINAPPVANAAGKFWLVNTPEGPKALYMVCTHLGCLYKWDIALNHFKCPCHNSEYSREGDYIAGPTSRSLDQFTVEVLENGKVVGATQATPQGIAPPALTNPQVALVVNTGQRIMGQAAALSPARRKQV